MIKSCSVYQIRIQGHLDSNWGEWFGGLTLVHEANGETTLSGPVRDQSALAGLLHRLCDMNLTLVSLQRLGPAPKSSAA